VRVYNNTNIEDLAERAASDFRGNGWNAVVAGKYPGVFAVTMVYFRPGTDEDAEAHNLGAKFNLRVEPRFEGIKDAAPGVIVIVAPDYTPR
jgi:LytR cell envelope-related transcriptional attenuator